MTSHRIGSGTLVAAGLIAAALAATAGQVERARNLDEILNPKHTALIVHEMLNDWISAGGADDKRGRRYDPARVANIIPPIQQLIAQGRAKSVRIVYMRYT